MFYIYKGIFIFSESRQHTRHLGKTTWLQTIQSISTRRPPLNVRFLQTLSDKTPDFLQDQLKTQIQVNTITHPTLNAFLKQNFAAGTVWNVVCFPVSVAWWLPNCFQHHSLLNGREVEVGGGGGGVGGSPIMENSTLFPIKKKEMKYF